jgi:hypothetical protein
MKNRQPPTSVENELRREWCVREGEIEYCGLRIRSLNSKNSLRKNNNNNKTTLRS